MSKSREDRLKDDLYSRDEDRIERAIRKLVASDSEHLLLIGALRWLVEGDDENLAKSALDGLQQMPGIASAKAIAAGLSSESPKTRAWAALVLGEMAYFGGRQEDSRAVVGELIEHLGKTGEHLQVQEEIVHALCKIGGDHACDQLVEIVRSPTVQPELKARALYGTQQFFSPDDFESFVAVVLPIVENWPPMVARGVSRTQWFHGISDDLRKTITDGSRAEMEGILKEFCPELLLSTRQPDKLMTIAQILSGAERPAPAIPVSPTISQLATLIRARREAGDQPYTLLLGSSLSLTTEVRQAVCGSDDWEASWTAMERLSAAERRALLAGPFDSLNLAAGYRYLAQLVQAGYFDFILTLNVDDALDESLRILSAREYQIFTHGQVSGTEIAAALSRSHPRVKAVKLRGDINAYKLPLTPEGQFEFPERLEKEMERLLSQDTILVGDVSYDTDIQRCIHKSEGALWVVVPEEPRSGSFLYHAKKARPTGGVVTGPEAEFVPFFSALARELGVESSEVSDRPRPAVQPSHVVAVPNPFGDTGRITDPDRFFGREELLRQIFEELGKGVNLSLVGESQIGKSSLLSMICALGPERMGLPLETFAYVSLEWVDNEDDFYEALCEALSIKEPCRGYQLTRALRDKRYVLCLDEIEKMTWDGFTVRLRSQLRGLADGPAAPLKLVIASRSPLAHLFPDSPELDSPLAGICRPLDVGPFPPDVAHTFLVNRLRGTGVIFTENEISTLLAESGGHPAKLQRAAADLYRRKCNLPEGSELSGR
jgi:hypothetical protein